MKFSALLFAFLLPFTATYSQPRTVGLVTYTQQHEQGYYLYTPLNSTKTFLLDECGDAVRTWKSAYRAGVNQILTPDGELYRSGLAFPPKFGLGSGGFIERYDWNGNLTWTFKLADSSQVLHHDISLMPNGNILAIVWERIPSADAIAYGRKSSLATPDVWNDRIIEIQPIGKDSFEIVWEWSAWEHVIQDYDSKKPNFGVVSDHPERFDLNYTGNNPQDWFHLNAVDYNPTLDQIIICAHAMDEFYIIDHSTNSVQAAGHSGGTYGKGGDVLYRWGNPQAYKRGQVTDQRLYKPHHAHWIKNGLVNAGKIMVFNNGLGRPGGEYSSVDIITPPTSSAGVYSIQTGSAYGPTSAIEYYKAQNPTDFYAMNMSGAYSLSGGGLLITAGPQGQLIETNSEGEVIWKYTNPVNDTGAFAQGKTPVSNQVFRAAFYPKSFSAFSGKTLTSQGPIERNPYSPTLCEMASISPLESNVPVRTFPNPAGNSIEVSGDIPDMLILFDSQGRHLKTVSASRTMDLLDIAPGLLRLEVISGSRRTVFPLIHN